MHYALEQFRKNNLRVMFLMLIGYVTETKEDHLETLAMFKRWQKYVATGTITGIDLGVTLLFLQGTPLEKMIESHGVSFLSPSSTTDQAWNLTTTKLWTSSMNPDFTIEERIRRRIETHKEAIKYNWPIWRGDQRLQVVKSMALNYKKILEEKNGNST